MKYPINQFENLKVILKDLQTVIDLNSMHPCALHFEAYQQVSKGHTHNWIYKEGEQVTRAHKIADLGEWEKVVKFEGDFELYPEGCNDPHIETAVKRAIKEL